MIEERPNLTNEEFFRMHGTLTPARIERLNNLAKRLRGDNKAELLACIEALDDIAQCTFYAADYGRNELWRALAAIV